MLPAAVLLSYFSLTIVLNLLGRYNRPGDDTYCASVLVAFQELLKFLVCILISLCNVGASNLRDAILSRQTALFALPSIAFAVQKNLDLASMKRLEIPIYLMVIETKSVLAALWSRALLGRRFSWLQVVALLVLAFGDALAVGAFDILAHHSRRREPSSSTTPAVRDYEYVVGTLCGLLGTVLSSWASVYSERLLKMPGSIWVRNVQFGCSAVPAALIVLASGDLPWIAEHGLLQGFTPAVWLLGCLVSVIGMVMAACLKYVSAVAIGFVRASTLVFLTLISIPLFGFKPSANFSIGGTLVVGSMALYAVSSHAEQKRAASAPDDAAVARQLLPAEDSETQGRVDPEG